MFSSRFRLAALAVAGSAALAGCTTYDPYGYSGVSVGVGYGSPYGAYGYGSPYGAYGYDYGSPYYGRGYGSYYGWNDGFYYPGTGYYVYDRYRRPYRWSNAQRRYWEGRRYSVRNREIRQNWEGFRTERRQDRRAYRVERRDDRQQLRRGVITREEYRADRREDRKAYRADRRQDRKELRRENRRDRRDDRN